MRRNAICSTNANPHTTYHNQPSAKKYLSVMHKWNKNHIYDILMVRDCCCVCDLLVNVKKDICNTLRESQVWSVLQTIKLYTLAI